MAANASLKIQTRTGQGKGDARKLRAAGRVPAVVYGRGEETRHLTLDAHEVSRLFSHINVEATVITLQGDGGEPIRALVREVQSHPVRGDVIHLDFYQIHAGERVGVEVPIRLVGTAEGVKEGGVMDQVIYDLAITCLADQIPDAVEVDVSALHVGGSVHVRDLTVPSGVTIEVGGEQTVCVVTPPTVAAATEVPEAEAGVGGEVEPELIRDRGEGEAAADAGE